jgi:ribosomal protein S18 acetylase RimI-like enzyme
MIALRQLTADDWQLWRKLRLEALAEAPYAFGAKLSDWQGPGDTEARWRARLTDVPLNIVAEWESTPAGMIGGTAPGADGSVELISMWVAPFARGRGVGDALVQAVVEWARDQHAVAVVLGVKVSNERAVALYRRNGFTDASGEGRMLRML